MTVYAGHYGPVGMEYPDGRHAPNTPILIKNLDGSNASLWLDMNRVVAASNPISTDDMGNLSFWAEPGRYNMVFANRSIALVVNKNPFEPAGLTEEDVDTIAEEIEERLGQTDYRSAYLNARNA